MLVFCKYFLSESSKDSQEKISLEEIQKIFEEVIRQIQKKYGFDLRRMKIRLSAVPINRDGMPNTNFSPERFGGSHTNLGVIYVNSDPRLPMKYYLGNTNPTPEEIQNFLRLIIAHELAHEIWCGYASEKFKKDILRKAKLKKFTTEYLRTVPIRKYDEECFCEWIAKEITSTK